MIKEIKKLRAYTYTMLTLISIGMVSFSAQAGQNLPSSYPEKFDLIGVAYKLDRTEGYIDVLAHHYTLAPTARFYTLSSDINSLSDLKKDTVVGLVFDTKQRVMGIYQVPSSMYVPN